MRVNSAHSMVEPAFGGADGLSGWETVAPGGGGTFAGNGGRSRSIACSVHLTKLPGLRKKYQRTCGDGARMLTIS